MISFEDYSDVILYKQASDYAQVAMKKYCEHDSACRQELLSMLGRTGSGEKCVTVTRTAVSEGRVYEDVDFILCV